MALWMDEEFEEFIQNNKQYINKDIELAIRKSKSSHKTFDIIRQIFCINGQTNNQIINYIWYNIEDLTLREKKIINVLLKHEGVLRFNKNIFSEVTGLNYWQINRAINELWSRSPPIIEKIDLPKNFKVICFRKNFLRDCMHG